MINSIESANIPKRNPFGTVTNRNNVADYWLVQNKNEGETNTLGSILPDTIILNPEEARKTHNLKIIGISIATATVLTASAIFFVLRGGPKGVAKGFQSIRDYLERKVQMSKLKGATASGYEYLLGKADFFLGKAQAINNFTTIKDFTFKKLMYGGKNNWKYTRKIHNSITEMFEKLGLKTVANSYKKTFSKFDTLRRTNINIFTQLEKNGDLSKQITVNGITLPKHEWLTLLKDKGVSIETLLKENFSESVRQSRYLKIKKFTKELEQSFDEKGALWFLSKDTLKTFVAESAMLPKKLKIQAEINDVRRSISYTPKDLYIQADAKIMKIASNLKSGDKNALELLNQVRENFKQFSKTGVSDHNVMLSTLSSLEAEIGKSVSSNSGLEEMVAELRGLYTGYKKGSVQDILDIYKALLPKEQYQKAEKEFKTAIKSLDKSTKLETEDFINKSRDLAMGSAPTDILTVLGGFGTLAYYLGKSDNGQERTAITLKYGIPALVGVGVSLYGNARLFAGSKSLFFATVSSILANRVGTFANNLYENYLKKSGKYIPPKEENTLTK